ncbi:unnamed protein product [Vicia faba]|uniref:Uncharacterized protein n=1 Tax=Vicia faba TaxID=3906 RepID=A0AAV0Z2A5_VICFA|nr:unnamed protein product [Vicia faba]
MKSSLSYLFLTTLLLTSLFHQNISAASPNNTDDGATRCIGLRCLSIFINDEADLFMDQLAKSKGNPNIMNTMVASKLSFSCGPNKYYLGSSCVKNPSPQYIKLNGRCDRKYRAYQPGCP